VETVIKTSIFSKNNSDRRHFVVALVIALAIFYADLVRVPAVISARQSVYSLMEPAYVAMAVPGQIIDQVSESIRLGATLQEENNQLRKQNLLYSAQLQRLPQLLGENAELRRLSEAELDVPAAVKLVEVIGVDPDPSRKIVIIRNEPGVKTLPRPTRVRCERGDGTSAAYWSANSTGDFVDRPHTLSACAG